MNFRLSGESALFRVENDFDEHSRETSTCLLSLPPSSFHRWMKLSYPISHASSPFLQSRKIRQIQRNYTFPNELKKVTEVVYRSRLSLTRFPSRALTLGGREGLKKSFSSSTANPLTCLDAMSIYRTTLVLPCFFFPLLPLATVIPCRVFLEKFYTPFTASSKSKLTNQFFITITISRRAYSRYRSLERNI